MRLERTQYFVVSLCCFLSTVAGRRAPGADRSVYAVVVAPTVYVSKQDDPNRVRVQEEATKTVLDLIRKTYAAPEIRLLTDDRGIAQNSGIPGVSPGPVTAAEVMAAVDQITGLKKHSLFIFYFIGHGILKPIESNPPNPEHLLLLTKESPDPYQVERMGADYFWAGRVERAKPKEAFVVEDLLVKLSRTAFINSLILLDCCYSGPVVTPTMSPQDEFPKLKGRTVMFGACNADERVQLGLLTATLANVFEENKPPNGKFTSGLTPTELQSRIEDKYPLISAARFNAPVTPSHPTMWFGEVVHSSFYELAFASWLLVIEIAPPITPDSFALNDRQPWIKWPRDKQPYLFVCQVPRQFPLKIAAVVKEGINRKPFSDVLPSVTVEDASKSALIRRWEYNSDTARPEPKTTRLSAVDLRRKEQVATVLEDWEGGGLAAEQWASVAAIASVVDPARDLNPILRRALSNSKDDPLYRQWADPRDAREVHGVFASTPEVVQRLYGGAGQPTIQEFAKAVADRRVEILHEGYNASSAGEAAKVLSVIKDPSIADRRLTNLIKGRDPVSRRELRDGVVKLPQDYQSYANANRLLRVALREPGAQATVTDSGVKSDPVVRVGSSDVGGMPVAVAGDRSTSSSHGSRP